MKKWMKALSICLLLLVMAITLVACVPSNVEKAKEKMQDAGYSVASYTDDADEEGFLGGLIAYKDNKLMPDLTAIQFSDNDDAEDYYEDHKNDILKKNVTLKGKWVFWGNEEAVKEFK